MAVAAVPAVVPLRGALSARAAATARLPEVACVEALDRARLSVSASSPITDFTDPDNDTHSTQLDIHNDTTNQLTFTAT